MPNIMYHFVGCDESLKGISVDAFRAQLSVLEARYSKDEFTLTFDHGTHDHIEHVAPELEKRGLRGLFFILTMVPEEHRVAPIDKQRFLEAANRTELARVLCVELGIPYDPRVADGYLPQFGFYSQEERYLRYLRDTQVDATTFEAFIGKYFQEVFGDEADFASGRYLSWDEIAQLRARGHIIGSHTHYHYGDHADYARSVRVIKDRIGANVEYVSYPNGWKRISDSELETLGIKKAYISSNHGAADPYRAARIDCNQWTL